jgi:hypothetical protein
MSRSAWLQSGFVCTLIIILTHNSSILDDSTAFRIIKLELELFKIINRQRIQNFQNSFFKSDDILRFIRFSRI